MSGSVLYKSHDDASFGLPPHSVAGAGRLEEAGRAAGYFAVEAAKAEALGARYVAHVFQACVHGISLAPKIAAQLQDWPVDLAASGLAFRLNAGLHALMRRGAAPNLCMLAAEAEVSAAQSMVHYQIAVTEALTRHEDELLEWLARPTQTNEVGRIAGLMGVLAELDARCGLNTEILELGASAGLNLNLAHYHYDLGGQKYGSSDSAVRIAPIWKGLPAPEAQVRVTSAKGVDLAPVDVGLPEDRERLYTYIWPGMPDRMARLHGAIGLAQAYPPHVEKGRAGPWLDQQLAVPQRCGTRRVIFHSMVMQYVPVAEREAIARTMQAAGQAATPDRPLARVALEWREDRREVQVLLTLWDGSSATPGQWLVATCHPYAEWFDWRGLV